MFSIRHSSVETVSCLLSLGADANAKDKKGLTALDYTSEISRKYPTKEARQIERQMRQLSRIVDDLSGALIDTHLPKRVWRRIETRLFDRASRRRWSVATAW